MAYIKAIETIYKDYKFRSRTEARWAIFFDTLGIEWEFEKEGYVLSNGKCYLPDFYLPKSKTYVEVKGQFPSIEYIEMLERFSSEINSPVMLVTSLPSDQDIVLFAFNNEGLATTRQDHISIYGSVDGEIIFHTYFGEVLYRERCGEVLNTVSKSSLRTIDLMSKSKRGANTDLKRAFSKAKQAQFEHGKRGE
jgi:hypothetical protein